MRDWRVMLYAGDLELTQVDLRWGMSQGDSSSFLVFVLGFILLV